MGIMGTDSGYKLGDKVSILKNTVRTGEKEIDSVRQELNLALGKFYGGLSGMEKVVKLQHAVAADADENLEAVVKRYGNTNDEIVMLNDEVKSTKAVYADAVAIQGEKRVAYEQALQQEKTLTEKINIYTVDEEGVRVLDETFNMPPQKYLGAYKRFGEDSPLAGEVMSHPDTGKPWYIENKGYQQKDYYGEPKMQMRRNPATGEMEPTDLPLYGTRENPDYATFQRVTAERQGLKRELDIAQKDVDRAYVAKGKAAFEYDRSLEKFQNTDLQGMLGKYEEQVGLKKKLKPMTLKEAMPYGTNVGKDQPIVFQYGSAKYSKILKDKYSRNIQGVLKKYEQKYTTLVKVQDVTESAIDFGDYGKIITGKQIKTRWVSPSEASMDYGIDIPKSQLVTARYDILPKEVLERYKFIKVPSYKRQTFMGIAEAPELFTVGVRVPKKFGQMKGAAPDLVFRKGITVVSDDVKTIIASAQPDYARLLGEIDLPTYTGKPKLKPFTSEVADTEVAHQLQMVKFKAQSELIRTEQKMVETLADIEQLRDTKWLEKSVKKQLDNLDDQIDNAMSRQMTSESGVTQTFPDYKKAKVLREKKAAL